LLNYHHQLNNSPDYLYVLKGDLVQLIFSGNIFVAAVYRLQVAVLKLANFFIKRGADKVCKLKLGVNLVLKKYYNLFIILHIVHTLSTV